MDIPKTIIVPTDLSDLSKAAIPHARALAEAWGAQVVLVYVIPPSSYPTYHVVRMGGFPNLDEEMRKAAKGQLQRLAAEFGKGVDVTVECREGRVFREVEYVASQREAGLIVIATHGRSGVKHAVLGSKAERIVRTSQVPVLTVHASKVVAPLDPSSVKRILVPTDFSETSRCALDLARWFASSQTELLVCHVFEPPAIPGSPLGILGTDMSQVAAALRDQADESMKAWMKDVRSKHPNARERIVEGHPADELVRIAKDENVDLVAISTHGHTGLEHLYMGSVAERVVCRTTCPVLTVREDAATAEP